MGTLAITRAVSSSLGECELTHLERQPIDVDLASAQHERYCAALEELGCRVLRLREEPDMPDAVFVEDTAIVLDEVAILTRPGALSRRPECPSIRAALAPHRTVLELEPPAIMDGGDVLVAGRTLYVGRSSRTNEPGIEQLSNLLRPYDYEVVGVGIRDCLHLTSAVTLTAARTLLIQPAWVDPAAFDGFEVIEVDRAEPTAANCLKVGDRVLYSTSYPNTIARLESRGLDVHTVDYSELEKAEGAMTCCSLILKSDPEKEGVVDG